MRVSELGYGNKLNLVSGSECGSWHGLGQATSIPPVRHTNYHSLNIPVCSVPEKGTHFADKGTLFAENDTISGSRNGYIFWSQKWEPPSMFQKEGPRNGYRICPHFWNQKTLILDVERPWNIWFEANSQTMSTRIASTKPIWVATPPLALRCSKGSEISTTHIPPQAKPQQTFVKSSWAPSQQSPRNLLSRVS